MDPSCTKRYDIPLSHLDYKYIENCTNVKELEKIYKILQAGDEGKFPDLERFCENHLRSLDPQNRVLRTENPVLSSKQCQEWDDISSDLTKWLSDMKTTHSNPSVSNNHQSELLPPVRSASTLNSSTVTAKTTPGTSTSKTTTNSSKRVVPRSAAEWARLEKELETQEDESASTSTPSQPVKKSAPVAPQAPKSLPTKLNVEKLSLIEKQQLAEAEKQKGNEAFRSGDFAESVIYYTRSISAVAIPASYNNRALAYLKLKKYTAAVKDCNRVLKAEPNNTKALMRRATAYKNIHKVLDAQTDLQTLLSLEPGNKKATELLTEIEQELKKRSDNKPLTGGRRMVIAEVDSSDEEEEAGEISITPKTNGFEPQTQVVAQQSDVSTDSIPQQEIVTPTTINNTSASIFEEPATSPVTEENPVPETKEAQFDRIKEEGNSLFKAGKFSEALVKYGLCSELYPEDPVPYTNRAVCYIKLDKPNDAIYECNEALEIDPSNMKAIFRRGVARRCLGYYRESLMDLNLAKSFDPMNKQIDKEISDVQELLRSGKRLVVEEIEDEDSETESLEIEQVAQSSSVTVDVQSVTEIHNTDESVNHTVTETNNSSESVNHAVTEIHNTDESVNHAVTEIHNTDELINHTVTETNNSSESVNHNVTEIKIKDKSVKNTKHKTSEFNDSKIDFPEPALPNLQVLSDCSAFDFMRIWFSVKALGSDAKAKAYCEILRQIESSRVTALFSNKLDGEVLSQILSGLRQGLLAADPLKSYQILFSLSRVSRFGFVVMFLSQAEKSDLRDMIHQISQSGVVTENDLLSLSKLYGISS